MPTVIFQDAPCRAELLSLLSSPQVDPWSADESVDFGGGVPSSGGSIANQGLEWLTQELQPAVMAEEHPVTVASTPAVPAEFLGGSLFNTMTMPLQTLRVARVDFSMPAEDFATSRRDSITPFEISGTSLSETSPLPLEHPGATFGDSAAVLEFLQAATQDSVAPTETIAQLRMDWTQPLEGLSQLLQSGPQPAEIVVSVFSQPTLALELLIAQSGAATAPLEALELLVTVHTMPEEWLVGVQPSDGRLSAEMLISVAQSDAVPAEALSSSAGSPQLSAEILSTVGQLGPTVVELLSQEQGTQPVSVETFSLNVTELSQSPVESLITAAGDSANAHEWLSQETTSTPQPQEWLVSATGSHAVPWEFLGQLVGGPPTPAEQMSVVAGNATMWVEQSTAVLLTHPMNGEWLSGGSSPMSAAVEWTTSMSWAQQQPQEWLVSVSQDSAGWLEHLGSTVTETSSLSFEHLGSTVSEDSVVAIQWSALVGQSTRMPMVSLRTVGFVVGRSFHVRSDTRTVYVGSDAQIWVVDP